MYQQKLKMKNTTNKIIITLVYSLTLISSLSCSNEKKNQEENTNVNAIIHSVDTIVAIGKVQSEYGKYTIASNTSGIVSNIFISEGDQVEKGQVLLLLSNPYQSVDKEIAYSKLKTRQDEVEITKKDLDQEKVQLDFLKNKLATSKILFDKNAETKENLILDQTNYTKQKERVRSLESQLFSKESLVKEQLLEINKTTITAKQFEIHAPNAGLISDLNVNLGQFVNETQSLGDITDINQLIIEAEVDELFADLVKIGQKVVLTSINTKQQIGEGEIIYTSPILANKSILYENANEAEDRRVRQIKIKPLHTSMTLLINAKIECQIKTK